MWNAGVAVRNTKRRLSKLQLELQKPGKNKTAKTGEEKGYDQLPGLKNRDIIVAKKDLERAGKLIFDL